MQGPDGLRSRFPTFEALQSASYLAGLVESLSQDGMEAVVPVLPDL